MKHIIIATAAGSLMIGFTAIAQDIPRADTALLEKYVAATWKSAKPEWKVRVDQDEIQRLCTETSNNPSPQQAEQILKREAATVAFPADGNISGNWQEGEKISQSGRGGQFSDGPDTVSGGNCYACHQMRADELSYGTLGPSLLQYGKLRDFTPDAAKAAYAKIYNAQSVFPCSQMPRFGYHKFLSEQQVKDVVAYLFAKDSPVNK